MSPAVSEGIRVSKCFETLAGESCKDVFSWFEGSCFHARQIGKAVKESDVSIMQLRAGWNVRCLCSDSFANFENFAPLSPLQSHLL